MWLGFVAYALVASHASQLLRKPAPCCGRSGRGGGVLIAAGVATAAARAPDAARNQNGNAP
jgi:hypothetical protein